MHGDVSPILRDDVMAEAGRKAMLANFTDMLQHEPIARLGQDIEGVHKMRVATRKLRSNYRVFGDYIPTKYHEDFPYYLKHTARVLGNVRDLDVMMQRTADYVENQLNGRASALKTLSAIDQAEHRAARTQLLTWLDSKDYARFIKHFENLLADPLHTNRFKPDGRPRRVRVADVLPSIVYETYGNVRCYEMLFPTQRYDLLHRLRISAKRLRYTLDAFSDVLGDNGEAFITSLKQLQEHLGDLNDAVVAIERLSVAIDAAPPHEKEGLETYHTHYATMQADLMASFPAVWQSFNCLENRQTLALAIATL